MKPPFCWCAGRSITPFRASPTLLWTSLSFSAGAPIRWQPPSSPPSTTYASLEFPGGPNDATLAVGRPRFRGAVRTIEPCHSPRAPVAVTEYYSAVGCAERCATAIPASETSNRPSGPPSPDCVRPPTRDEDKVALVHLVSRGPDFLGDHDGNTGRHPPGFPESLEMCPSRQPPHVIWVSLRVWLTSKSTCGRPVNVGASSTRAVVSGRASRLSPGASCAATHKAAASCDEGDACAHTPRAPGVVGGPHAETAESGRQLLENFFEREFHVQRVLSASRRILA